MKGDFDRAKRFISVWWVSRSIKEVADKMGITQWEVYLMARQLRELKVPLKKFAPGNSSRTGRKLRPEQVVQLRSIGEECRQLFSKETGNEQA